MYFFLGIILLILQICQIAQTILKTLAEYSMLCMPMHFGENFV